MRWISQIEAEQFLKTASPKIKVIYYVIKDCPHCDDFIPDVIEPLVEKYSEHFEGYKVDSEDLDIKFPPSAFPTGYFFVPGTKEKMPLLRYGGAIPEYVEDDFHAMIEIKDQGKTIEQAFFVDRRPALFPYSQSRSNPRDAMPAESSIAAYKNEIDQRSNTAINDGKKTDWTKK